MYLLSGFFQSYAGEILYNQKITKDFTTKSFLNKVSFLTQNPFVLDWASTVRENLFL
jgi:ABC-type transport system involved in cytochrome bd biosynthesis fused ATPase/permease subunit